MSYEILVRDLEKKSQDRVSKIWDDVRQEARQYRLESEESLEQEKAVLTEHLAMIAEEAALPILLAAEKKGLAVRDDAGRRLVERLYSMAAELLPELRDKDYASLIRGFAQNLPKGDWQKVQVNPADEELARTIFPAAEVVLNHDIVGGFIVEGGATSCTVDCTLEKRLERAWPFVVPDLVRSLVEGDDHVSAS